MLLLEIAFGFALLFAGGEFLVRAAVALARHLRVSRALIGLTVVAFGTSLPEAFVSLKAALIGAPGIAIGNVVGSNVANVLLVAGLGSVLATVTFKRGLLKRDGLALVVATVVFFGVATTGHIATPIAAIFLLSLIAYVVFSYRLERKDKDIADLHAREAADIPDHRPPWQSLLILVAGFAGILLGAELLIGGAIEAAELAGVSQAVIGLTLVALGTSLPELAASAIAAWRGYGDVAMANILGSCLFNICGVLGVVGLVAPLPVVDEIIHFDNWILLGVTLCFVLLTALGTRIPRAVGGLFLLAYAAYITLQFVGFSGVNAIG